MRNKIASKNIFPPTHPFFLGAISLLFFYLLPPEQCRGVGARVSPLYVVSAAPSFSERGLLTLPLLQHEGSSWGKLFSTNFYNMSPSHGLQLFRDCASVGPSHGVQSFIDFMGSQALPATCSGVGSSLQGSAGPGRSLLQHGLLTGSQPPSGIPLLWCGVPSTGCR